ncbi:hypothetical protein D6D27_10488 [Aureobasidium pullulans]|nr:hypothetical protein D6D27_10488 [Aureobasidium pullulans]
MAPIPLIKLAKDTTLVSASKPSPRQRFALRCINLGGPFQSRWTSTCLEKYGVKEPHLEFGIRLQIYRSSVSLESLPLAEESCTHLCSLSVTRSLKRSAFCRCSASTARVTDQMRCA